MIKSGIYIIRNKQDKKFYIGSAVNIEKRFSEHIWALNKGIHNNIHLQRAWSRYGQNSFSFETFFRCKVIELIFFEQLTIDSLSQKYGWTNLYNLCPTAGSTLGRLHTLQTKIKIGLKSRGKNIGRKHSKEELIKMSKAQKGRIITKEHRIKLSEAHKGKKLPPFTKEHKTKISMANKGHKVSAKTRRKLSIINKGKVLSAETRKKIGDAFRGKPGTRLGIKNKVQGPQMEKVSFEIRNLPRVGLNPIPKFQDGDYPLKSLKRLINE